jgi:hypothetical protein
MKRWTMDFLLYILFSRAFPLAGPVFGEQWRKLRPRLQESLTLYTTNAAYERKVF